MIKKVRIGVVGMGFMGATHIKNLEAIDACELTAVCDRSEERIKGLQDDGTIGPQVAVFNDYQKLIASGCCDAIAIVTPHLLHMKIAICAFEAGLHVMCDKPISVTVSEADRMIAAWAKTDLKFSTMFSMRTNPSNLIIKEWLDSGRLGVIRRVEMTCTKWLRTQKYYDSQSWRATWLGEGGGLLLNQAPHNLDLLSWWFGSASDINAQVFNRFHHRETEDEVDATIWTQAGFPIRFYANTAEAPGRDYLEIVGDKGTLIREDDKLLFKKLKTPLQDVIAHSEENMPIIDYETVLLDIPNTPRGHKVVFESFFKTILENLPNDRMVSPGDEGINAVEWGNAMLLSAFTGQTVKLPLDRTAYDDLLNNLKSEKIKLNLTNFPR